MKNVFVTVRWVAGIFICLLSIAGFSAGDTILAVFTLIIGVLLLPPVTGLFVKGKKKNAAIPIDELPVVGETGNYPVAAVTAAEDTGTVVRKPEYSAVLPAAESSVQLSPNVKKGGLGNWFKNWRRAISVAHALESTLKQFPHTNPQKISILLNAKNTWSLKDRESVRLRIIDRYDRSINADNVDTLGPKYLDLYKTIFPELDGLEIVQKINVHKVESFIFSKVKDNEALSPNEVNEIINYSNVLQVSDFNTKEKIRQEYDYYITNWELDNGYFRGLTPDFLLKKNELCIYKLDNCELLEKKSVTSRVSYGGGSYRVKITKGFSYRLGSYNVSTDKKIVDVSKGKGLLNVTNQRIIFKGKDDVTTINTNAIVFVEPFKDAVVISKSTGKPLTIKSSDAARLYQYIRSATRR